MTGELAEYMAGVFAWSIDFFRLYPGDEFKVIYNENQKEHHSELTELTVWFKIKVENFTHSDML